MKSVFIEDLTPWSTRPRERVHELLVKDGLCTKTTLIKKLWKKMLIGNGVG